MGRKSADNYRIGEYSRISYRQTWKCADTICDNYRQGLWVADTITDIADSCEYRIFNSPKLFGESILPAEESQDLGSIVSIMHWWSLIEYADAGGYGLGFTITTLSTQSAFE